MRITISQYKSKSGTIGIELKFSKKPSEEILERLRNESFSWHRIKKVWYTVETPEARAFAEALKRELEGEPEITNTPSEIPAIPRKQDINSPKQEDDRHSIVDYTETVKGKEPADKVPVKVIELSTAFREANLDIDSSGTFDSWKDANDFVASLIDKHSNVYYNVMWQDGQAISGAMDLDSPGFFDGQTNLLSEHIKRFYTNVSKAVNDPIFDDRAIAFTKKILNGYLFEDIPEAPGNVSATTPPEADEKLGDEKTESTASPKDNSYEILREFYHYVVTDPQLKDPLKVSDDVLKQWLAQHYDSLSEENVQAIIKLHHLSLIGIKKNWIRKTGEPIKRPYSTIYDKLHKVIPDLEKHLKEGAEYGKSKSGGFMDLNFDYLGKDKHGYVFALSHYYEQNGDLVADPDMQIRLIPEMKMAEALTFQDFRSYQEVYHEDENGKEFVRPRLKKDLNSFLSQWLTNLVNQKHKIILTQKPEEFTRAYDYDNEFISDGRNIIFNPVVMARYADKSPFFQQLWKDKYDLRFLKGNEFTFWQMVDLSAYFNSEVLENIVAEEEYQELYEQIDDKAYTVERRKQTNEPIINLSSIGKFSGPFTLKQSWTELDEELLQRLADFMRQYPGKLIIAPFSGKKEDNFTPVAEIAIKLKDEDDMGEQVDFRLFANGDIFIYSINKTFGDAILQEQNAKGVKYLLENPNELLEDVSKGDNVNTASISKDKLTDRADSDIPDQVMIKDIVCRDKEIPNVMIPTGIREPFASHNFYHKDMLMLVPERFSDLSMINTENLSSAGATQLYELIQLSHPDDYPPITLSRFDLLDVWEERGEAMFQQLGLPTDRSYPYVNIHTGYSTVNTLGAVIGESNDKDKWWTAASDYRPVGDMGNAIIIIDEAILELTNKKSALINPKTGKPKGKEAEEARDIDFEISRYERSKDVIEGFLSGYSQEQMEKVPQDIRSALWNQSDDDYPVNKNTINGVEFNQAWLRVGLSQKIKSLSVSEAKGVAEKLAARFKERRSLESYFKGTVTIGKKGDDREKEIIWSYIDDIIIDHDLNQKDERQGATKYLLELLYPDHFADNKQNTLPKEKTEPKNQHELNKAIERFIDEKDSEGDGYSESDKNYIRQYMGSGGLHQQGASGEGILYEFYTPDELVQRMWGLAHLYGFTEGNVLEPACGTGRFLKYTSVNSHAIGFEVNHYAKRIAEILYPWAEVIEAPFETIFFAGNVHLKDKHKWKNYFDLIIGNPPYGPFSGKYAGMGEKKWTGATQYDQYFMLRCLDLLKPGGLLVFLIPSAFLDNDDKYVEVQKKIDAQAELVDAYRLPNKIFPTTDWGTDIIVLRKNQD